MSEPRFSILGELIWYGGLLLATVGPPVVLAASAINGDPESDAVDSASVGLILLCVAAFPLAIRVRRVLVS